MIQTRYFSECGEPAHTTGTDTPICTSVLDARQQANVIATDSRLCQRAALSLTASSHADARSKSRLPHAEGAPRSWLRLLGRVHMHGMHGCVESGGFFHEQPPSPPWSPPPPSRVPQVTVRGKQLQGCRWRKNLGGA